MHARLSALLPLALALALAGCPQEPDDDDSAAIDDDDSALDDDDSALDDDDSGQDDDDSAPTDADGDGVPADEDCDDDDPDIYPGNDEACDGLDNDCDGEVDDGLGALAEDEDADGWTPCEGDCDDDEILSFPGNPEDCDQIDNDCDGALDPDEVDVDGDGEMVCEGDCDDADPNNSPQIAESCDGQDNDCDDLVDEGVEPATWYADLDGDGVGGDFATTACDAPAGHVASAGDCDDGDPAVHPAATEVCNGVDDDCDGDIDEDSAAPGTWYADLDGDGAAGPLSIEACAPLPGFQSSWSDCDDSDPAVFPGATEVCNGIDDDCDGGVDEGPAAPTVAWADADGDGVGGSFSLDFCAVPAGFVTVDGDCNDGDPAVYPGAPETCDGQDEDCDGVVDDGDLDGDGLPDCSDPDTDGDGLRDAWDVDPLDAGLVRGPNSGLGADGDHVLAAGEVQGDLSFLSGGATAADVTLQVEDGSPFAPGDELLVLSLQGSDAGAWETVFVAAIAGDMLSVEPPLVGSYDAASAVLVQRIPHYVDLDVPVGLSLAAVPWQEGGGGVVVARAQGTITIAGAVLAHGAGFAGGAGVVGNGYDPHQGESWSGLGAAAAVGPNEGGGGAYPRRADNADCGGGGSYGGAGAAGTASGGEDVTEPGLLYGDVELAGLFLGSGGGGGSPDTEGDGVGVGNISGDGGSGGGLVLLFAGDAILLEATGSVEASGADGQDAASADGEVGAGGAGAGGTVLLGAPTLTVDGAVLALGGLGGDSASSNISTPYGDAFGGDGGDGRIRLDVDVLGGTTSPAPGHVTPYLE
jgi:hypothetical protein